METVAAPIVHLPLAEHAAKYVSIVLYCKKPNQFADVYRSKSRGQRFQAIEQSGSPAPLASPESIPPAAFKSIVFESIAIADVSRGETNPRQDEVFVSINVSLPQGAYRNTLLKAKLDTGAQGNILPMRLFRQMFPHCFDDHDKVKPGSLSPLAVILTVFGGSHIKHYGTIAIPCTYQGTSTLAPFYITDTPGPAIIGLPTSTDLKLLSLNFSIQEHIFKPTNTTASVERAIKDKQDLISHYAECFNGIGKFQGEYHIVLDPSVPPVVHPPRRVPISLKNDIKKELDDMVKNGIIAKIEEGEPTQWVNSLVYRHKQNGKLRLCLNPKDLNAAIRREHNVIPTLEEILPKLDGAKVFSIVDARFGYWNVGLDKGSSYLTTFNSPFGR